MVRKIHREAQFEGAGSTSGAATGRGIVQAAMSQLQQGINGQGVPGNLFPKAPWRTSPTNQGPSIDGRDDVEVRCCDPVPSRPRGLTAPVLLSLALPRAGGRQRRASTA
jgi:hypothetical protein